MELKKGENMIEHEAEIYSRPARTWFQTGKEKLNAEGTNFVTLCRNLTDRVMKLSASNSTKTASSLAARRRKQNRPTRTRSEPNYR